MVAGRPFFHARTAGAGCGCIEYFGGLSGFARRSPAQKGAGDYTPHPGEMARLTSLSVKEVEAGRVDVARSFAKHTGMIVVLKGRFTLIAHPDGTVFLNPTGSPALAKAGSGDVLTGMIGSLLAQKVSPLEAAAMAVYLHGKAAGLSRYHPAQYGVY